MSVTGSGENAGIEYPLLALTTDSGEEIEIVRCRVCINSAAAVDAIAVRFLRCSTLGSTPTSATIVKKNPLAPNSAIVASMKNGLNDWSVGTVTDVLFDDSFVGRSMLEWTALDQDDKIIIRDGEIFELTVNPSTTNGLNVFGTVEWKEE